MDEAFVAQGISALQPKCRIFKISSQFAMPLPKFSDSYSSKSMSGGSNFEAVAGLSMISGTELVQEEVQKLSKLELNWDIALQQHALVEQDQIDWRVHRGNSLHLSKVFDVARWWATQDRLQFPLVALAPPRILARPSSNTCQERGGGGGVIPLNTA